MRRAAATPDRALRPYVLPQQETQAGPAADPRAAWPQRSRRAPPPHPARCPGRGPERGSPQGSGPPPRVLKAAFVGSGRWCDVSTKPKTVTRGKVSGQRLGQVGGASPAHGSGTQSWAGSSRGGCCRTVASRPGAACSWPRSHPARAEALLGPGE